MRKTTLVVLALASAATACRARAPVDRHAALGRVNHFVVIYLENRSFDNLYGQFPGAIGLADATYAPPQVDARGHVYITLPQAPNSGLPDTLPNAPFAIERFIARDQPTLDLVHRFYQEQEQIDRGTMDRFAQVSDAKGLAMGYYRTDSLPLARLAARYTLCDRFFHSAFGGSFLNHIWLVAAATPVFPRAPAGMIAAVDSAGRMRRDGAVTPDGYVVNTAFPAGGPYPRSVPADQLVPAQTMATIGDRLTDAGLSWAWYAGGWKAAEAGHPPADFQYHHQPFAYFAAYAPGTRARAEHLLDESDFIAAARAGTLPAVSFVKPSGADDEHPGYTNLLRGEQHAMALIDAVRNGPDWHDTAIIVTYDENGGFWDQVSPPKIDRWGPGTRVPAIVISPLARKGYVDHTTYETASILATIEHRWKLAPLTARDGKAMDLANAFGR
ncbi:MAG: alkaline phosphatase family protein [Gemmatimonadaceae bacterium]